MTDSDADRMKMSHKPRDRDVNPLYSLFFIFYLFLFYLGECLSRMQNKKHNTLETGIAAT